MRRNTQLLWPLAILVCVLLADLILIPGFFSLQWRDGRLYGSLIDILNRAVPVLLLSIGMTLVIATGGVDLSVGAIMAITGAVAACLIARPDGCILNGLNLHNSIPAILAFSLAVALLCGLFNGLLVSVLELQPIVATLLLMVAGRGVAQLLTNGQIINFSDASFQSLGAGASFGLPNPIWIFAGLFLLASLLMRKTALGLFVEAVGSNPQAARLSGVNAKSVKWAVYAVCGLCAGVAGLIGTADIKAADASNAGLYLELDAILAVAIGGTSMAGGRFSLAGSVVGVLLMQTLTTTILTKGVAPEVTLVLKALVVVGVCLFQAPKFRAMFTKVAT